MTDMFSEQEADAITAAYKIIYRSKKRMGVQLIKEDGVISVVTDSEPVTREDIVRDIQEAKESLAELEDTLAQFDALNGTNDSLDTLNGDAFTETPVASTEPQPEQPAEQPPVVQDILPVPENIPTIQ